MGLPQSWVASGHHRCMLDDLMERLGGLERLGKGAKALDLGKVGGRILRLTDRDELLAVSGPDGTFEVRGFKPGRLLVRASRSGRSLRASPRARS